MIFIRPDDMTRKNFQAHIEAIAAQFQTISPYGGTKPFLKIEDRCYSLRGGKAWAPLYFLGRGFKSYAEFNIGRDVAPVIRHLAVIGLEMFESRRDTIPRRMNSRRAITQPGMEMMFAMPRRHG